MARRPTGRAADAPPGATARHAAPRRRLALAALLACAAALPVRAQSPPPAAAGAVERHVGKMVFAELVTPDVAAAERFYGPLFGWTFQAAQGGHATFTPVTANGRVIAGLVQRALPAGRRPAWLTCLATTDVDAADATATQHGAKLLYGPYAVATLGRESVIADPQGAVFGLLSATAGDPADTLAARGTWIWSSLITADPQTDATFYQALLGYQVYPLDDAGDPSHLILASGDFARASVNPIPAVEPQLRPRWLSYVRVDDVAASAAQAQTLGGQILVAPHADRHGGRIAIVADPAGAPFGLMEWSEDPDSGAGDVK